MIEEQQHQIERIIEFRKLSSGKALIRATIQAGDKLLDRYKDYGNSWEQMSIEEFVALAKKSLAKAEHGSEADRRIDGAIDGINYLSFLLWKLQEK